MLDADRCWLHISFLLQPPSPVEDYNQPRQAPYGAGPGFGYNNPAAPPPPRQDFGPPRSDFGPPRADFGPPRQSFGPGPPRVDDFATADGPTFRTVRRDPEERMVRHRASREEDDDEGKFIQDRIGKERPCRTLFVRNLKVNVDH